MQNFLDQVPQIPTHRFFYDHVNRRLPYRDPSTGALWRIRLARPPPRNTLRYKGRAGTDFFGNRNANFDEIGTSQSDDYDSSPAFTHNVTNAPVIKNLQ